jgi:polyferredoxin
VSETVSAPPVARSPLPVRAATVLLVPLIAASSLGLVLFGIVWADEPFGPGLVFGVVALAAMLTVLAALPSLLRGERTGWLITTGWAVAYSYWSVYKVFAEEEFESWPFLVAGLLVTGLLLSAPARQHARR